MQAHIPAVMAVRQRAEVYAQDTEGDNFGIIQPDRTPG